MPHDSVVPIIIEPEINHEYYFFSGTGFFVKFNPYKNIFLVTAKHCVLNSENQPEGDLKIKLNSNPECNKVVPFNLGIIGKLNNEDFPEDVIVYEVGEIEDENRKVLEGRALPLYRQDYVEDLIKVISFGKQNVRILGYPSVSKEIDYENNLAIAQSRGIVGKAVHATDNMRWITVEDLNWKEGYISGFSGSPVFALISDVVKVQTIPIGIVSTGNEKSFKFISINVATNLIEKYLSSPDHHMVAYGS